MSAMAELAEWLRLNNFEQEAPPPLDALNLSWYARQHRAALIDAGALKRIANAWWVHPERFAAAVLALGEQHARETME